MSTSRDLDWDRIVKIAEGQDIDEPIDVYEFGNGKVTYQEEQKKPYSPPRLNND